MKILVLVLSFCEEPYLSLMRQQQATWDSIEVEGVKTVYYYGGGKGWVTDKEFSADASDSYFYMTKKCALALREVLKDFDPQYIFRVNSSGYVNKSNLRDFVSTLPTEKIYAGWTIVDSNYDGKNSVSGAGILMSQDVAKLIIEHVDCEIEKEEDIVISRCLKDLGIEAIDERSRIDYPQDDPTADQMKEAYHIRFKGPSGNRLEDANNMIHVHKLITQ